MLLLLALATGCHGWHDDPSPDVPERDAGVVDTGAGIDADSGGDGGETADSSGTGEDTGGDTAADTGKDTASEYPVKPPEWPDCGTLSDPVDFGGDGWSAFVAVFYSTPGTLGPIFGLLSAFSYAAGGECEGYGESGEVQSFTGSCSTHGTTLSGEAEQFLSETSQDWWATATDFVYVNDNGSAWEGSGAWAVDESGADLTWTASGYDHTTPPSDGGSTAFRGGFDREDSGACLGIDCRMGGYVLAVAVMDVYDGEFCYASAMEGGDHWTGPGVLRVIGTERIEVVLTSAYGGYYTVDGGAPVAF